MIVPGGALVLVQTTHLDVPENAWLAAYNAVLDDHVRGGLRARWKQPDWVRHEGVLLESPFGALKRVGVTERIQTPGGGVAGPRAVDEFGHAGAAGR